MPMGWDELAVILVIALVIIGPSRLPEYAAKLARGIRKARVLADGAKLQLKEQMGPEFEDVNGRQYDPRQYDPRKIVRDALREPIESAWDPVKDEFNAVRNSAGDIGRTTPMPASVLADSGEQTQSAPTTPYDTDAT